MYTQICHLILFFFIYSFLGWLVEVAYWFVAQRRFHNPGIIGGPFCPIYGCGTLLVIIFLKQLEYSPPLVFVLGTIIVSAVEYISHMILQKWFGPELWDYRNHPLNLQGRISLSFSLSFGVMLLFVIYVMHPRLEQLVALLPGWLSVVIATLLALYFLSEFIPTLISAAKVAPVLKWHSETIDDVRDEVERRLRKVLENDHVRGFTGGLRKFILKFHRYNIRRLARISVVVTDKKK